MEDKHTPGPWQREGQLIYTLMHHGWHKGVEQFRNRFWTQAYFDRECGEEECEATTSLIAAAPDLLEALRAILVDMRHEQHHMAARLNSPELFDAVQRNIDAAEAAIAKATGGK